MSSINTDTKELYLNKPECVIDLPQWLLSPEQIEEYRSIPRLAIVEMAGRDSVAAAIKRVEEESLTDLLPTYAYTGTEHGSWSKVPEAVERLKTCLPGIRVYECLASGSPGFWQALNGRFISELITRFGFYTPCIGCHLYLHSIRIPLAVALGNVPVISGERELHNGVAKINQTSEALDCYQSIFTDFGVRLHFPLRHITEGSRIEAIIGMTWQEGEEQLSCVLSGNYQPLGGNQNIFREQVKRYLEEFALPCTKQIIGSYLKGHVPNHKKIAAQILGSVSKKESE